MRIEQEVIAAYLLTLEWLPYVVFHKLSLQKS